MKPTEYSPTRSRSTWKPRVSDRDLPFFKCEFCSSVFLGIAGPEAARWSEEGRSPVAEPPYLSSSRPDCCGNLVERVRLIEWDEAPADIHIDYRFEGGFNNNCLKVTWSCKESHELEWVCVKTFTGSQIKYVMPGKRPPLIFAFADEDAFAYCDKSPCVECSFRCKAGMIVYASVKKLGVIRIPLDRMIVPNPTSSSHLNERNSA